METVNQLDAYRLDALLGEGGMAQVYKAWNLGLHRYEALKLLSSPLCHDREFVQRFLNEARMAARLHHPHIATIHAVAGPDAPQPYFTMEWIEGGDLADLLRASGALPTETALPLIRQIAQALDYAHEQGIIHRDVKPANILLHRDQTGGLNVKLVDFGIARAQEDSGGTRLTKAGMIVGTPEYMSPEQAEGKADVDFRTDIYSLGIVAYEMLCGGLPFAASTETSPISLLMCHLRDQPRPPVEWQPALSPSINSALLKALAKAPQARFRTCRDFSSALAGDAPPDGIRPREQMAAKPALSAAPVVVLSGPQEAGLPPARRPPAAAYVGIGIVAIAGVSLVGAGLLKRTNVQDPPLARPKQDHVTNDGSSSPITDVPSQNPGVAGKDAGKVPTPGTNTENATSSKPISENTGPKKTAPERTTFQRTIAMPPTASASKLRGYWTGTSGFHGNLDKFLLQMSNRELTEADLIGKPRWDLIVACNQPYALHGYRFKDQQLANYFLAKPWYHPLSGDQDSLRKQFTRLEQDNTRLIRDYTNKHFPR